jgi:hypothetical protein
MSANICNMAKKKTSTPAKSDTSGMSLADFKANYTTAAPSSASVGIAGKTYNAPGTSKAYVGPNYTEDSKVKTAGKGFAGSGTPLGTSIAGTNLSKGNVAKTAAMAVTFGGIGPAAGLGSYVKSKVNNTAIGIGINAAEDYMGNAIANLASKMPNVGGNIKNVAGTVFTEVGSFPGKETFLQTPARTIEQMAGTLQGQITKAENQATKIAGYVAGGAKTGIKTGAAVGGAIAGGAGTVVGYLVGSNKNKKKK